MVCEQSLKALLDRGEGGLAMEISWTVHKLQAEARVT
jgi:hypothetical protein